jgi:8-oxo-dGTP pyrophosphatase MutT (NUDIX family)
LRKPVFFSASEPLHPSDAAVAILILEDGRYIMQLRDNIPNIFYPNHWGCFGGAVDSGERPLQAVMRELDEELEFKPSHAVEFTSFQYDLTRLGRKKVKRIYYEVFVKKDEFKHFVLHEGKAVKAFTGRQILCEARVTPYDAFAVWLHCKQKRLKL